MKFLRVSLLSCLLLALATQAGAQDAAKPFLGRWALTIPGGGAGWLGVTNDAGYLDATILWGGGSVVPTASVGTFNNQLVVVRLNNVDRKNAAGQVIATQQFPEVLFCTADGDNLSVERHKLSTDGNGLTVDNFTGKRIADIPATPDLSTIKLGAPVNLFDGTTIDGWELTNAGDNNGWSVKDGLLVNDPAQVEGQPKKHYGNLRTKQEFEDFIISLDVNVAPGGNSGIYLRGIYEVQVMDSYAHALDPHNMGAVYSRITPALPAEKPAGEWQHLDITLCDRHVTVKLNNILIIDNQPLLGCTGGALWSDEFKPGPIYLQGDHTGIQYKNIVLTPIVK